MTTPKREELEAKRLADFATEHCESPSCNCCDLSEQQILSALRAERKRALEDAAQLHEVIRTHCDHEPAAGAGAMGAVIAYRDAIRALKEKP